MWFDMGKDFSGTLALDLGNTNTVIAFQGEKDDNSTLLEMPGITSSPGVIPTVVWYENQEAAAKIGESALKKNLYLFHLEKQSQY